MTRVRELAALLGALVLGCTSGGHGDSETHFLSCDTKANCPATDECVARRCVPAQGALIRSDSGNGKSRGDAGGARGDSGSNGGLDAGLPDATAEAGVHSEASVRSEAGADAALECDGAVSSVTPPPDALDVPASTEISASFGCPEDAATAARLTLTVSRDGQPVAGATAVSPARTGSSSQMSINFSPSRALALATTYVAELREEGTLLRTWSFTTRDGTWQDPETVATTALPHDALGHDFVFALNADGEGIVAWEAGGTAVSARRFDVGSGLSATTEAVVDPAPDSTQELAVGIDANRRATVAWMEYGLSSQQPPSGQYFVNSASADPGGAWGPLRTAYGPAGNSLVDLLDVGMMTSDAPLALWTDTKAGMALADLRDGAAQPFAVAGAPATAGRLTTGASGAVWVTWKAGFQGGVGSIFAGRISVFGTWNRVDMLSTSSSYGAGFAASADGSAIAVFNESTFVARRFTEDAGWSGPVELDTRGDAGTTSASSGQVALDPKGNAIALFGVGNGSQWELRSQRFTPGTGWANLHEILDVGSLSEHSLGFDASGRAFALGVTGNGEVRAARWLPGSGWQASTSLGHAMGQSPSFASLPLLGVLADGRAVAIWRNQSNLILRRFRD